MKMAPLVRACSIVATKANVPVAHLEAGLRSGDGTMPEETRLVTEKLVGSNPDVLPAEVDAALSGQARRGKVPDLWDGKAGERAAEAIRSFLS